MSKTAQKSFRAWPKNQERIDYAVAIGLNVSELINRLLEKHLREAILKEKETRLTEARKALEAPVP